MTPKPTREDLRAQMKLLLAEARLRREASKAAMRPPRYDDVFFDGVAWLDELAKLDDWSSI